MLLLRYNVRWVSKSSADDMWTAQRRKRMNGINVVGVCVCVIVCLFKCLYRVGGEGEAAVVR